MIVSKAVAYDKIREIVISELTAIGGKIKGERVLILCPFHNDSSPSCNVNIGDEVVPGAFYCFSCKAHGNWNTLASALKLRPIDIPVGDKKDKKFKLEEKDDPFAILSQSLKRTPALNLDEVRIKNGLEPLPLGFKWRGIGRNFYNSLGGKLFWDKKKDIEYLYFPLNMNDKNVGYTLCCLADRTKLPPNFERYLTFADTKKVLFLYDQLPINSPVVLVEGHFDALRLHALGIPTVGIFGTSNWSSVKREFLAAKNPKKVLILMDGDKAGYDAAQEIFLDLRSGFDVEIFYLPYIPKPNSLDPGNMPDEYVEQVRSKLC